VSDQYLAVVYGIRVGLEFSFNFSFAFAANMEVLVVSRSGGTSGACT
ncbi:hypothetical protein NPIL_400001, partial [Nephila pilipes]